MHIHGQPEQLRPVAGQPVPRPNAISKSPSWAEIEFSAGLNALQYAPRENKTEDLPDKDQPRLVNQRVDDPQLVRLQVANLRPHPSYIRRQLSVPTSKIDALERLGDRVFEDPIVVTQDGMIIDGYARWELGKKRGLSTMLCLVYKRTAEEALCDFLWRHCPREGLNAFTRIEVTRDLKPNLDARAQLHQQAGGRDKGSAKLEPSERQDSRKERARKAVVSEGNVTKVDRIFEQGSSATIQAARNGEISIHRAALWSSQTQKEQKENLRLLQMERGLRQKARNLVIGALLSRCKPSQDGITLCDLLELLKRLSMMSPEESKTFGPVSFSRPCMSQEKVSLQLRS